MAGVYWKTITMKIPEELQARLEEYRGVNGFTSISEAARFALTAGLGYRTKEDAIKSIKDSARAEAVQRWRYLMDELFNEARQRFLEEP